jgi:hypothetical protein
MDVLEAKLDEDTTVEFRENGEISFSRRENHFPVKLDRDDLQAIVDEYNNQNENGIDIHEPS